ncbi:hypothetical protein VP1G_10689 [Cytospora mali]|uniref:Uncharacterized protein n=1 Tax=Cytospora mali TaxID=578113 RepID=A0A194USP0_CYTMA|nr:hypothetical protein VP1G_10689 [Valsa mali var. pyri (nom. inval.)]
MYGALNETADMNDTYYTYTPEAYFIEGVRFGYEYQIPGFYREFTGFQFVGVGQDPQVENRTDEPWLNTTFQLDTSVNMSTWQPGEELDPVPYNSTLWFNGSAIALDAPFLNMPANDTDCKWFDYTGLCLCYGDTLLTSDFRQDNNLICISEAGYVWGFSSVITLIGIIIEVCWIIGCFGMWLDVHINSTLFRMNRPASGLVRNILDIAGAIQRDLGNDTGAYKNRELVKALEKCSPVGYEVDDTGGKVDRIVMVSVPAARERHSRLRIDSSAFYA